MWYGDYYGVMSFEVNTKVVTNVPKDWSDLLKPEYKNMVALVGDPPRRTRPSPPSGRPASRRTAATSTASSQASQFFKQLNDAQQLRPGHRAAPRPSRAARRRSASRWTYNGLADKDSLKGNPPIEVVVPTSGRFGGMYVQAISKYAPHPNAAKLWMEYLYSDEGQNIWLSGYCNPIRYDDMAAKNTARSGRAAKLPDIEGHRPADPRPDHGRLEGDHRGLADHRRRDRQVTSTSSTKTEW